MTILTYDTVYPWLNRFELEKSYLSLSVRSLFKTLEEAWKNGKYDQMLAIIDSIDQVTDQLKDTMEMAEASLQAARWLYAMLRLAREKVVPPVAAGKVRYQDVVSRLHHAAHNYLFGANPHNQAVALWMLGWVFLEINQAEDALAAWEQAKSLFGRLMNGPFIEPITDWYREQFNAMKGTIQKEIKDKA